MIFVAQWTGQRTLRKSRRRLRKEQFYRGNLQPQIILTISFPFLYSKMYIYIYICYHTALDLIDTLNQLLFCTNHCVYFREESWYPKQLKMDSLCELDVISESKNALSTINVGAMNRLNSQTSSRSVEAAKNGYTNQSFTPDQTTHQESGNNLVDNKTFKNLTQAPN